MRVFDHIAIIYQAKAYTSSSKQAKDLADSVNGYFEIIQKRAVLYPVKRPGDAGEVAYETASKYARPLLISIGDLSIYHEVINGVMQARQLFPAQHPVVINVRAEAEDNQVPAHDDTPLIRRIKEPTILRRQLLCVNIKTPENELEMYSDQAVTFGLSSALYTQFLDSSQRRKTHLWLTRMTKNQPALPIRLAQSSIDYQCIVFKNPDIISPSNEPQHTPLVGFQTMFIPHAHRLSVLSAALRPLRSRKRHKTLLRALTCTTTDEVPIIIDSVLRELPKDSIVAIRAVPSAIDTLY